MRLRCPDCRKAFAWDASDPWPRFCPLCSADINNDRADDDIPFPFIQTSGATKSTDQLYRSMEAGSEARAQEAASILGVSAAEVSDLKITDLKDARHPGEVAAPPLPAHLQNYGSFGGGQGVALSPQVQSGPFPNAGAKFQSVLREVHGQNTQFKAVGDAPALETLQPGYRRRA